ncbi:MAG: hypothetical protein IPJ84_19135 [Bdellovibrionales bacterium]|nr:hypothetical protein [Bdellovibrionales bacterium]MBK7892885.1 hypothetical protein [Bdellovibrionales bacterium]
MMERQAKDGTFYHQVGPDHWEPVTRTAKTGEVYKKIGQDQWAPTDSSTEPSVPSAGDKLRAATEGYAESASIGTLPYLKAGGEVLSDMASQALSGSDADETKFSDRVNKFRQQGKDLQEKAPGYAMGGQFAGFVVPGSAASKAVGAGIKGAAGVNALEKAARFASGSSIGAQSARLGAEGVLLGTAYTPETGFTDVGARAKNAAINGVTGALMPGALHVGGKVLKGAGKLAAAAPKKILSAVGGVKEEVIDSYLQNPERIRNASTFDELYEQVTKVVNGLGDDLDNAKIGYDSAKSKLDEVAAGIKDSRVEGKAKAMEEVQKARTLLDESFSSQKQVLTEKASPSRVEPMIGDAIDNLKEKVVKGSNESYEILRQQKEPINFKGTWDGLKKAEESLNVAGVAPSTPQARAAQAEIRGLRDTLGKLPSSMSAADAKQIIQQIDQAEKIIYDSRLFTNDVQRAFKSIRGGLDEQLKQNPAYKEKMLTVADDTGVLSNATKQFGADSARFNRLQSIGKPSAKYELETLQKLAQKQGGALPRTVDEMVGAQRTLRSPMKLEGIRQSLPENAMLRQSEMQAASAKRLAKPREIQKSIERSAAFFNQKSAQAKLKTAKDLAGKFKGFGEQSAESKLKQVAQGRKFATKTLQDLSDLSDQDFVEAVRAASDAAAFTKTAFNGSRNVNLWSVIGNLAQSAAGKGGAGGAAGFALGGPVGMAFGAVTGAMMDVYGPAVTKRVLDGVLKMRTISPNAIRSLDIPEPLKIELIQQFKSTVLAGRAAAAHAGETALPKVAGPSAPSELDMDSSTPSQYRVYPDEPQKPGPSDKDGSKAPPPKRGREKWANDGFDNISKHSPELGIDRDSIMQDPKAKEMLVLASDLKPGSKAMNQLVAKLNSRLSKGRD